MTQEETPRLEAFKDTCGDYEKPHQYINRLHAFAGGLEIECASLKKKADAHDELLEALIAFRDGGPIGGQDFEGWHQSYLPAIEKARAAIRKATGEQQ